MSLSLGVKAILKYEKINKKGSKLKQNQQPDRVEK